MSAANNLATQVARPFRGIVMLAMLCAALLDSHEARAQRVMGPGDDAFVLPRGVLRWGTSFNWSHWDQSYGDASTKGPAGEPFSRAALGTADVPALAPTEQGLRSLSNLSNVALSLGTVRANIDRSRVVTPLVLEYGLLSRLTLSVNVPFVRTRTDIAMSVNPNLTGSANVGPNPALFAATGTASIAKNAAVSSALRSAANALQQEATKCQSTPTVGNCPTIINSATQIAALIGDANSTATAISSIYGDSTGRGAAFVPLTGSALQLAIVARIKAINASFKSFLGTDLIGAAPAGAPAAMTLAGLQSIVGDSAFGINASALETVQRSHIGDVEVGATMLLFDSFGRDERRRTAPAAVLSRVSAGALVRLGTGQKETPEDLGDLGTGDGQTDVEARIAADIATGRRFWVSVVARYAVQLPDKQFVRVPSFAGGVYTLSSRTHEVDRDLGDFGELEITPRWAMGDYFAIAGQYRYRAKGADSFTGLFDAASPDGTTQTANAALLDAFTIQREHRIGFGATYSTLAAYARGKSAVPLEISLLRTIAISGRNTPALADATVRMRIYTGLARQK